MGTQMIQSNESLTKAGDYPWYPLEANNGRSLTITIVVTPELAKEMLATSTGNPRGREGEENLARWTVRYVEGSLDQ